MPTLSYCAFENTSEDIQICVEKLKEAVQTRQIDWSEYETRALPLLVEQCELLVFYYNQFLNAKIVPNDYDGE